MSDINALRESLEQRMNTLDERNRELKEAKAGVENTLKSENALRRELELELDQLIMDRSRMVNEGRVAKGMRRARHRAGEAANRQGGRDIPTEQRKGSA